MLTITCRHCGGRVSFYDGGRESCSGPPSCPVNRRRRRNEIFGVLGALAFILIVFSVLVARVAFWVVAFWRLLHGF